MTRCSRVLAQPRELDHAFGYGAARVLTSCPRSTRPGRSHRRLWRKAGGERGTKGISTSPLSLRLMSFSLPP